MKIKKMAITFVLGGVLFISALLGGCFSAEDDSLKHVRVAVVAGEYSQEFALQTNASTVHGALVELAAMGEGFSFDGYESEYGFYIKSVCGISEGEGKYWSYFTDTMRVVAQIAGTDVYNAYSGSYEWDGVFYSNEYMHNGKTHYSCAAGISEQALIDGECFVFVLL